MKTVYKNIMLDFNPSELCRVHGVLSFSPHTPYRGKDFFVIKPRPVDDPPVRGDVVRVLVDTEDARETYSRHEGTTCYNEPFEFPQPEPRTAVYIYKQHDPALQPERRLVLLVSDWRHTHKGGRSYTVVDWDRATEVVTGFSRSRGGTHGKEARLLLVPIDGQLSVTDARVSNVVQNVRASAREL